ncbi:glycosyltransferase family 39 protein [Bradyrhizobium guangdongense]|uniref:glycosyltransferase family 39 protein n=1 Tax=Bradyrhizobium guangdongense TaxID=1325090 RepID=UPI001FEF1B1F|nr:glycosyltransferase family 39 protein [Bradyrhizobium guangdongense]
MARYDASDIATILLIAALAILALCTFKDYAISNDEGVQHRYAELIVAYYASGFTDQSLFGFQNLYLYGGLFDVVALGLSQLIPIDPYDLRHILCALIGIGGIAAAALTARLVAGPRAALIATIALGVSGTWYGTMFNHTKDIPFAAAMMGATLFLIRIARRLPSPRIGDVLAFGLLAGAALGTRVLGLLLVIYAGFVIALYLPWSLPGRARWSFAIESSLRLLPALIIAYVVMILAWPWAALAPLNPIRGLLAFSEFHYGIRTVLAGQIYEMASVPRLYVPIYILIRLPLLILFGAILALLYVLRGMARGAQQPLCRDIILLLLTVMFPLACQVAYHGPAFTGLRHFLFVIPPLAVLAGIGLDLALTALAKRGRIVVSGAVAAGVACLLWDAVTLVRLHPYENLYYNSLVGGLQGASRRYDLDYWFSSMPEAVQQLETYLRRTAAVDTNWPARVYSVAVCGERLPFDKTVTLPQLRFDFKAEWDESEFFIAPTQLNCDNDLDGKIIATVERLGVAIAYVKDRRALTRPVATAAR